VTHPLFLLTEAVNQTAASGEISTLVYRDFLRQLSELLPRILWVIGILILTRVGISLISNLARRLLLRVEPTLRKFFIQAAEIFTLIVGIVAALSTLGIQTATLVAVLGAAGLAIGLALQNTLSHFAAGVMLISFRPFEVGDVIEGAGVTGQVDSIGIFSTTILTPDNVKIVVPNSNLFSGNLKNMTAMGTRRVDLEVDIEDRPIEPTITHLLAVVQPHPLVLNDPKLDCHVARISSTGTVLYLRPWCAAEVYEQTRSEIQKIVKEALDESANGITKPQDEN
jgi:small conductance mechanosensitive channel